MRVWFGRRVIVLGFVGGFTLLMGAQGGASQLADTMAVNTSLAYLQSRASELGIRNAYEEFRLRQVVRDSPGETHARFDQVYQGVPVVGQQLIVHLDRDGTAQSVTGAYLSNPTQDGHSIDTFADYHDRLDVHYSSGIANNAYFLLAEGGTHRLGGVVSGIGRSAAERIFYRALTVYMIPSETFSQARAHTTQAAIDLFGQGSQQVISVARLGRPLACHEAHEPA